MKKDIPVQKEDDLAVSEARRKEYALTRDQQAMEHNEAITRRIILKGRNLVKCEMCGKEFGAGNVSQKICPDCRKG